MGGKGEGLPPIDLGILLKHCSIVGVLPWDTVRKPNLHEVFIPGQVEVKQGTIK